jgi:hypothetical protein
LSSSHGDLVGYDYFLNKKGVNYNENFVAQFTMPSILGEILKVNLWMKGYNDRNVFTVEAPYSRAIHQNSVPDSLYHQPLPTLVVRQAGEAGKRPFVSVIDAFNAKEENRITEVAYFSPEDGDSDFVGIQVQSSSMDRIDHIYSSRESKKDHIFLDGQFKGTYGVISYKGGNIHSIFLGKGNLIEGSFWKIESIQGDGDVLIEQRDNNILMNAQKPFKLTMPLKRKAKKVFLEFEIEKKTNFVEGKIDKRNKQVEFELPVLTNCITTLRYK